MKHRSFLKWAGGKFRLVDEITKTFPHPTPFLVEPFVGSASLFLNTDCEKYLLADINADLINLFNTIKNNCDQFLHASKQLLNAKHAQSKDFYYQCRDEFNRTDNLFDKAVLFLYLNRHGYNGLCRYNSTGVYNVPFGSFKKIYFPEKEIIFFAHKAQKAEFICADFRQVFAMLTSSTTEYSKAVIYCDPPYSPLPCMSEEQNFTRYAPQNFTEHDHHELAALAEQARQCNHHVIISNHYSPDTKKLYHQAKIKKLAVQRSISPKGASRKKVAEILATFAPQERS